MPNISLTTRCNRSCSYCFARGSNKSEQRDISPDTLNRVLDFLLRSDICEVRLLGGEPTLHPSFCDLFKHMLSKGFKIRIFTGGIISDSVIECLESNYGKFTILLNTAVPGKTSVRVIEHQIRLCRLFQEAITLGITFDNPDVEPAFMFQWIERFNLSRTIRVGIANPSCDGNNDFLKWHQYRKTGQVIEQLILNGNRRGIQVGLDCGFVPCMFSESFANDTGKMDLGNGFCCGPIPDIMPDGSAIPCYALSSMKRFRVDEVENRDELIEKVGGQRMGFDGLGIYKHCIRCHYNDEGLCRGGCLGLAMKRLRGNARA